MRKSLFSKIFTTQIIVALTVVAIIIPMIIVLTGEYLVSVQKDDVLHDAVRASEFAAQMDLKNPDNNSWEFFRRGIEFAGGQSNVIVMNEQGDVIATPQNVKGINLSVLEADFLDGVRGGETEVLLFEKGRLFSEQTIVAIVPIKNIDHITGKNVFVGAAIAFRPTPMVRKIQNKTIRIILMAQLLAWLVALLVSFIITRHIIKPIKKMRVAAKEISAGKFDVRIPITSNDEIGELAHSFNSMTQSLSELENMRKSFLSDVSHELRTPMTIISGFVEGILDGTIPPEQQKKYLGIVSDESKRLSRLVKDLLEATRLEQNVKKLEKTDFDMNRLVVESIVSYENQLTEKNISVNLELEEKGCYAFADKDSIKRVLLNLIDNAIKFTPDSGNITVCTTVADNKIKTYVENSGEGIPKEDLRHIWDRFYKSDKSRSMDKKGVGLGLHIVKTIISHHNEEIFVESEERKYTRFTFTLEAGKNS